MYLNVFKPKTALLDKCSLNSLPSELEMNGRSQEIIPRWGSSTVGQSEFLTKCKWTA